VIFEWYVVTDGVDFYEKRRYIHMSKISCVKEECYKFSMYACTQEEPSSRVTTLCKSHISYMTTLLQLRLQPSVSYNVLYDTYINGSTKMSSSI
jgi:hypothetical protein